MFKDNKAQMVGDIVTVAIYEQASASKEANTATGRSSEISAGIPNFFGLEGSGPVLKNPLDPSKLVQGEFNNDFSGQGSTSRKANLSATIAAQVVEVLPNDNLRIFGRKRVQVNNEEQFIGLSGVIRPQDISAQNMVNSKYIVNAEITYTGRGPLSDKQRPGWLMRLLDTIWPF
jgi:flagellar L-ring protein precursor FlgH